jgi:hypothetical protein
MTSGYGAIASWRPDAQERNTQVLRVAKGTPVRAHTRTTCLLHADECGYGGDDALWCINVVRCFYTKLMYYYSCVGNDHRQMQWNDAAYRF